MTKTLFHKRIGGHFGRGYDCWYVVSKHDGTFAVEHAWSHPAASADGQDDVGTVNVSAGQFFAKVEDQQLLSALRSTITKLILDASQVQIAAMKLRGEHAFDPFATVIDWLSACRSRDLDRLIAFYDVNATLDCACTGTKICNGHGELRAYWEKRLADLSPLTFTLQDVWPSGDSTVLDYISHSGQLVRAFFYFGNNGLIAHSKCGPVELAKAS
jgi:hypothetical protein